MELPSLLESMAEASVTLAGFAAVFRAFAGGADPDGHSSVRLNLVIEGGLVVAFLCYLPAALAGAGLAPTFAWRTSNIIAVAWVLPRSIWPGVRIIRQPRPFPALFPMAFAFGVIALAAFVCGISGLWPAVSAHQVGLVCQIAAVGCTFVAQFRVEQSNP